MKYDPHKVATAFQRLFRTYRTDERDDADDILRVYFEAVAEYETEDILAGVSNMLAGKMEGFNPSFLPPAPLVAKAAREAMLSRLESVRRRNQFLPKPKEDDWEPPTPEQRARALALVAKVKENIKMQLEADDAEDKKARKAIIDRANARFDNGAGRFELIPRVSSFNVADEDGFDMGDKK